jgi:hypothetical protein
MYDKGQGVPQDYKTAVKWYRLSNEYGYHAAATALESPEIQSAIRVLNRIAEKKRQQLELEKTIARLKPSCLAFGFKDGSTELSKCLFDLFKLEAAAKQARSEVAGRARQNRDAINNANANAAAQRELVAAQRKLAEQQLEERRFQGANADIHYM